MSISEVAPSPVSNMGYMFCKCFVYMKIGRKEGSLTRSHSSSSLCLFLLRSWSPGYKSCPCSWPSVEPVTSSLDAQLSHLWNGMTRVRSGQCY